jgi:acyl-coenzyme A thioesterase PaaI-like protein
MTPAELHTFLVREFPQSDPEWMRIEAASHRYVRIRSVIGDSDLRPGGTVSANTLMALADTAMYLAVLTSIGPVPLCLTVNCNMSFLRRPEKSDIITEAKILKLGQRLAVGEVALFSHGVEELVAHATVTYSIPPHTAVDTREN